MKTIWEIIKGPITIIIVIVMAIAITRGFSDLMFKIDMAIRGDYR